MKKKKNLLISSSFWPVRAEIPSERIEPNGRGIDEIVGPRCAREPGGFLRRWARPIRGLPPPITPTDTTAIYRGDSQAHWKSWRFDCISDSFGYQRLDACNYQFLLGSGPDWILVASGLPSVDASRWNWLTLTSFFKIFFSGRGGEGLMAN